MILFFLIAIILRAKGNREYFTSCTEITKIYHTYILFLSKREISLPKSELQNSV